MDVVRSVKDPQSLTRLTSAVPRTSTGSSDGMSLSDRMSVDLSDSDAVVHQASIYGIYRICAHTEHEGRLMSGFPKV